MNFDDLPKRKGHWNKYPKPHAEMPQAPANPPLVLSRKKPSARVYAKIRDTTAKIQKTRNWPAKRNAMTRIMVIVPRATADVLETLALEENRSFSAVVRTMIALGLRVYARLAGDEDQAADAVAQEIKENHAV